MVLYFHGNSNKNEYYTYTGPDNEVALNMIRVDSPMKGDISSTDETKLSFQLVSIDTIARILTVRECLWNSAPSAPETAVQFGTIKNITFNLTPTTLEGSKTLSGSIDASLYPNPTKGIVEINISGDDEINQLQVFNSTGQQILSRTVKSKSMNLDLSGNSAGNYFIKIITNSHVVTKQIILVK